MRNYQITALTEVLDRAGRVVRRGDDGGEIYRRNLELLGGAVERGVKILRARQRQLGGSSLPRTGERPPADVEVSTWREFVRRLAEARVTWLAVCRGVDPGEFVNDDESLEGLGDAVSVNVTRVQELTAILRARVNAVQTQARISNTAPAFTNALARLNTGLLEAATAVGGAPGSAPPAGITVPIWRDFRGVFAAAQQTAQAAQSGSLATGRPTPRTTPGATPPAVPTATADKPGPAAEQPAPRRQSRRAGGSGGGEIVPVDMPAMPGQPAPAGQPGADPGAAPPTEQAQGIMSAWTTAFSTLLGQRGDTSAMFLDRVQDAVTVLNPTAVPVYQRPWFWPAVIGVSGLIGYDYYKKQQAKKPASKAAPAAKPATVAP